MQGCEGAWLFFEAKRGREQKTVWETLLQMNREADLPSIAFSLSKNESVVENRKASVGLYVFRSYRTNSLQALLTFAYHTPHEPHSHKLPLSAMPCCGSRDEKLAGMSVYPLISVAEVGYVE
jgi:hypothetical protein